MCNSNTKVGYGYAQFVAALEQYFNTMTNEASAEVLSKAIFVECLMSKQDYKSLIADLNHLSGFNGSGVTSWDTVQDIVDLLVKNNIITGISHDDLEVE